jgi:1,4-dihydroxy-2-naphthoate octaprenyltransferase
MSILIHIQPQKKQNHFNQNSNTIIILIIFMLTQSQINFFNNPCNNERHKQNQKDTYTYDLNNCG